MPTGRQPSKYSSGQPSRINLHSTCKVCRKNRSDLSPAVPGQKLCVKKPRRQGNAERETGGNGRGGIGFCGGRIKSCQVQSFLLDDPGNGRAVALLIPLPAANFSPRSPFSTAPPVPPRAGSSRLLARTPPPPTVSPFNLFIFTAVVQETPRPRFQALPFYVAIRRSIQIYVMKFQMHLQPCGGRAASRPAKHTLDKNNVAEVFLRGVNIARSNRMKCEGK